ncbi:hypothetical protein HanRHA438_Chr05g0212091 [Helianthus annuus]|uniref:Uncharacterized protein n=1 Tax=Helianthus annuus TaxID=4232 RepID=A0A9K3NMP2_HELAN|nr:hypothetical protein HanXRQr2_Chr05g0202161 [Helianthus annuus]KAJ0917961.1 hypothetical protein HanRHA438_Chr05g0212091 [Helianthus annuus]
MQPLCSPSSSITHTPTLIPTSSPAISWCRPKFPPPAPPLSGRRSPTITCNSSITCKPPSYHVSGTHTPHAHPGFFRQRDAQREREIGDRHGRPECERERRNTLTSLRWPETATRPMTPHGDDYDDGVVDDNLISPVRAPAFLRFFFGKNFYLKTKQTRYHLQFTHSGTMLC